MPIETLNTTKQESQEAYGQKEIPNIKIHFLGDYKDKTFVREILYTYECDSVGGYYEELDSDTGYTVTFTTQIIPFDILEKFYRHSHFSIELEEIIRSATTNKDIINTRVLTDFNHINIKHKLYAHGEPTIWYITLCHKKQSFIHHHKDEKKKEIKIIKTIEPLKKVSSDTLSEVKL